MIDNPIIGMQVKYARLMSEGDGYPYFINRCGIIKYIYSYNNAIVVSFDGNNYVCFRSELDVADATDIEADFERQAKLADQQNREKHALKYL